MKQIVGNVDVLGTATSGLCAVHCALMPFLLSAGIISNNSWFSRPEFELVVLILTSIFVYFSFVKPYRAGALMSSWSLYLALTGLLLVLAHHFVPFGHVIVVFGGVMIAIAHINQYLRNHKSQA